MKKILLFIAIIAFYIGAISFFYAENYLAGVLNAFSGTCLLLALIRLYRGEQFMK